MAPEQRRLAAIMFTDMVGYTALGQRNESLSLALVDEHRKLLRQSFARHGGKEVKTMGDAFLVEFPNALEAVRCAYDIQRACREFNLTLREDRRVHLRVGVHLGDVEGSGGDIMGDAVNVASRIEPQAEDGGVCISRHVYDQVANKLDLELKSIGVRNLKNVSTPVEVFKVVMPWEKEGSPAAAPLDRNRVAVLPFTNLSPNPDDRYFADGMTEELITTISRVPGLKVISRTSAMQYRDPSKPVSVIGRELGAGTLLEGSVRKVGDQVRITAQLIDAGTDDHLWAENYDRKLDDVFAIQSDVASRVAGSLETRLVGGKQLKDTDDIEAYTMYVRAMQQYHEGSEAGLRSAFALLERATARDPGFVRALAALAQVRCALSDHHYEGVSYVEKAEAEARRALESGPGWAEAHAAMATVLAAQDRFQESIAHAERAVEINPNLADGWRALGLLHFPFEGPEKVLPEYARAYELDPLSTETGQVYALTLLLTGNRDEAMRVHQRLIELNPGNPYPLLGLARICIVDKNYEMAQKALDEAERAGLDKRRLVTTQGTIYALTGRRKEAERQLDIAAKFENEPARLEAQLFIQTALGNLDEAFDALMRQAETHSWIAFIKSLPQLAELRKDPRFAEFCRKVGIPP